MGSVPAQNDARTCEEESNMRPQTVLIVDDEPDIRRVVGEILRDEGLHIQTAENADVAREEI